MHLNADDVALFHRDGFLVVRSALDPAEVDALRDECDRLLNLGLNCHAATGGSRVIAGWRDDVLVIRILKPVHDVSPQFAALGTGERVVEPLRRIMRDEPRFAHEKVVYKQELAMPDGVDAPAFDSFPEGYDEGFAPHTDAGWYTQEDGYPDTAVTCAVWLDETEGRGPLRFVPGSHRRTYPFIRGGDIDPAAVPEHRYEDIAAGPGDVVFFHSRLVHNSGRNDSGMPRRVYMATYCPSRDLATDPDRRNRPRREHAQAHERRYREAVAAGEYTDVDFLAGTGSLV